MGCQVDYPGERSRPVGFNDCLGRAIKDTGGVVNGAVGKDASLSLQQRAVVDGGITLIGIGGVGGEGVNNGAGRRRPEGGRTGDVNEGRGGG